MQLVSGQSSTESVTGSGDDHVDQVVWSKTLEEVEKGWLKGPLQKCDVPVNQPISRRFGLSQKKGKIRLIDDYTESGVNTCVTAVESPVLHTIDVACALLSLWFGECEEGKCDPTLVARTFDLASAYRQVALSSEGKRFACIRVFDPEEKCMKYFRSLVLPFGAVRSVHTFLRLARAIWWIGVVGCKLLWTSFYDDFISFCKPALFEEHGSNYCFTFQIAWLGFLRKKVRNVCLSTACLTHWAYPST